MQRLHHVGKVLREHWIALIPLSSLYLLANLALYMYIYNGAPLQFYDAYPPAYTAAFTLLTVLISILTGALLVLLIAKFREVRAKTLGLGATGLFVGSLAAGCPGCIFGLFPLVLGLFGITGSLALLPWNGIEFQLLTVGLLSTSIMMLGKETDVSCPVRRRK